MESKTIALVVAFAAVAIVLNAVRIPTIYWSQVFYQFSQIPIIAVFFLFGVRTGVLVGAINWLGAITLFPLGLNGIVAYSMDFISLLITLLGLYFATRLIAKRTGEGKFSQRKLIVFLTGIGVAFRGSIMPLVDFSVLYHVLLPLFFGVSLPEIVIIGLVPVFVLYNVTTVLYTVPIAFILATKASRYLNIQINLIKQA